mmetsp:Transcript_32898/g.48028  ORF Transcript_32898/g.48028 Transcript_32898/m.48028 type:complete len:391 (-) Transcript_32898:272-1444(-)
MSSEDGHGTSTHKHVHGGEEEGATPSKRKKLCSLGTGEMVHVLHFRAKPGKKAEFEVIVQEIAHGLYHLEAGISDVRVGHPSCNEVCFILTFLTSEDLSKFRAGPEQDALSALKDVVEGGKETFSATGTLMPDTHTLPTLLAYLKKHVTGPSHEGHDVATVGRELTKWFPRPEEYKQYVHWDSDATKYTRNLIFSNEHMDVLLMCWPPHCKSAIHSHESSSCWVVLVEGSVVEVQYNSPKLDIKFIQAEMKNPTGAVGRCTKLRVINEAILSENGVTSSYANDDIGVHRIENRSDKPAYTLHVYAPGLKKMKIFKESGEVSVFTVASVPYTSEGGSRTGYWGSNTNPDGVLDISAWNNEQAGGSATSSSVTSPALLSEIAEQAPPSITSQ